MTTCVPRLGHWTAQPLHDPRPSRQTTTGDCITSFAYKTKNVVEVVRDTVSPRFFCHLFLVLKKSGGWRPVIDLTFLNFFQVTPTLDQYQNTNSLILAQPSRICSYVADRSCSVSLRPQKNWFLWDGCTHCISQHWDFNALTSNLWKRLSPMAEEDLQWWTSAHNVLRGGTPVIPTELDTQLFTDALNIGWGAHWNSLTVSGVWTTTENTLHISVLDLEAIHRAMLHWLRKLMGLTVLVASNNSTVVFYINKQGRTWSIQLCKQTKRLLLMCQAIQIVLRDDTSLGDLMFLQTSCCTLPRCQVQNGLYTHLSSEHLHGNGESPYWICLQ